MSTPPITMPAVFLHGSGTPFEPGFVMSARGADYGMDWAGTDFYPVLERYRPEGMLGHHEVVFMVGDADDIDNAGGATDWCLEVEPIGPVTRHDLNWSSEISCLLSDGKGPDAPEVRAAAAAYWSGKAHHDENVWEYLAGSVRVVACEPYETYGMGVTP